MGRSSLQPNRSTRASIGYKEEGGEQLPYNHNKLFVRQNYNLPCRKAAMIYTKLSRSHQMRAVYLDSDL